MLKLIAIVALLAATSSVAHAGNFPTSGRNYEQPKTLKQGQPDNGKPDHSGECQTMVDSNGQTITVCHHW